MVVSWIKVDPEINMEGRPIKGYQDEEFRGRNDERVPDLYKSDSEPFSICWFHAIPVRAKAYKISERKELCRYAVDVDVT